MKSVAGFAAAGAGAGGCGAEMLGAFGAPSAPGAGPVEAVPRAGGLDRIAIIASAEPPLRGCGLGADAGS